MPKAKRSEAGALIAYFSLKPMDECEGLLSIIQELMRRRRREGRPKVPRKAKVAPAQSDAQESTVKEIPLAAD